MSMDVSVADPGTDNAFVVNLKKSTRSYTSKSDKLV